jgi:hypothetical protein
MPIIGKSTRIRRASVSPVAFAAAACAAAALSNAAHAQSSVTLYGVIDASLF